MVVSSSCLSLMIPTRKSTLSEEYHCITHLFRTRTQTLGMLTRMLRNVNSRFALEHRYVNGKPTSTTLAKVNVNDVVKVSFDSSKKRVHFRINGVFEERGLADCMYLSFVSGCCNSSSRKLISFGARRIDDDDDGVHSDNNDATSDVSSKTHDLEHDQEQQFVESGGVHSDWKCCGKDNQKCIHLQH